MVVFVDSYTVVEIWCRVLTKQVDEPEWMDNIQLRFEENFEKIRSIIDEID
jgi:hypothetical protein